MTAGLRREVRWPICPGSVPPLAEGFIARTETAPDVETVLVPGAMVALVPSPEAARSSLGSCGKTQLASYVTGLGRAAFAPLAADLVGHLGADLGAPEVQVLDVLGLIHAFVGDGGRVEHADQLGEGHRIAVVRGRAGQQQGIGVHGEPPGQLVPQAGLPDQVVGLVDDHRVPVHVIQVVPVRIPLERVDRDDDPLVGGERVAARRDLPLDPLDADRVQPDQRDREPGP
jgi:hypothetical protein